MKKFIFTIIFLMTATMIFAGDIIVNTSETVGKIKPMNAVNNGPTKARSDQSRGNFDAFKAAKIPFARTHDAAFCSAYGGEHTVDITAIFPDFSKDANKEESYDFTLTDGYLQTIREAGTNVFFRLGQKIEHNAKKYGVMPPKDFKKWAVICEHIIRHYNEGWNNGFNWNITYWEIWNEADLDVQTWQTNPRCWGGTEEKFFEFYAIAAKHLKKNFPNLKIGGPALAGNETWADRFLNYMRKENVPIDFFSWHIYATKAEDIAAKAERMRTLIDKYGYTDTESILDEWNYVRGWSAEYPYSVKVINSQKGAAFTAAVMCACQDKPVDMLMYYDARIGTIFNGLFDLYTLAPIRGYYPFYAWAKLVQLGREVKITNDNKEIYATAAIGENGRIGILITRYSEDDNVCAAEKFTLRIAGKSLTDVFGYLTDSSHIFTEIPIAANNGALELSLEPNSFIYVDIH